MKLRRWAAPAAAVALLACTACGSDLTPGTASVVNGSRITEDQVTDLADAQCTAADIAAESGQSSAMAVSRVKKQSLGLLIDVELSRQFGEKEGIEPDEALADGFYGQLEQGIAPLPGKTRTVLEDVFGEWAEGRAILVQAGSEATGEKPSLTNLEQLTNAGLTARGDVLKDTAGRHRSALRPQRGRLPRSRRRIGVQGELRLRQVRRGGAARRGMGRCAACRTDVRLTGVHDSALVELVEVFARLRAECGWKAAQTHRSLARHLLEETYETLEVIDALDGGGSPDDLREELRDELGDVLLQVYLHAAIAAETGAFDIEDVAAGLRDKMVRRNPHVFGDVEETDPGRINETWESVKATEKQRTGLLDGVPLALPALARADKVLDRLGRAGVEVPPGDPDDVGERLLALVVEARESGVDPEQALRDAVRRISA